MSASTESHRGTRLLITAAAFVVVIAGLKAGASLIIPVIVALFLSLLCVPPMRRLRALGIPEWLALVIVIVVATLVVVLVSAVVGRSLQQFESSLPYYRDRLDAIARDALTWASSRGIDVNPEELASKINAGAVMQLVADTTIGLLGVLSNVFLVILTMIFMLLEANGFADKLRRALGDPEADLSSFEMISTRVNKYLAIKAWVSLGTGACVTALTAALGVDFPVLWGLIALLFNFVPNIGSIIAAAPACLLALIQFGAGKALLVGAGYLVINLVIGNAVEPKLMGRRLGLSTLVVFLSLVFWGWVWGPVGMLLSVPLTVILKIALEHGDDFRWLSVLLGPADEEIPPAPVTTQVAAPSTDAPGS